MTKTTIVGISLGTRSVGIALMQDKELLFWKVQCFKGIWSTSKLRLITGVIHRYLDKYTPAEIVLKIPLEAYPSKGLQQLLRALEKVSKRKGIAIRFCTLSDLKTILVARHQPKYTKQNLMASIAAAFPELQHEYCKEQRNRNAYYSKVFEAVACALLAPLAITESLSLLPKKHQSL